MAMNTESLAMIKLDSTEEIRKNMILPFGDDEECLVIFIINENDVWVEKLGKRVLH